MIMNYVILESIIKSLVPIAIAVVLPIIMAWLSYRNKQHETDKRSEIVTAIIEKNPDIDVQEFLDKLNTSKKSYKEQLMTKMHQELLWGTICLIGGAATILVIIVLSILQSFDKGYIPIGAVFGVVPLAVGCGLLIAYNNAKKTLENLKDND